MKKWITLLSLNLIVSFAFSQYDWDTVWIAPSPGSGKIWELQDSVSDDFNYDAPAVGWIDTLGGKWINFYHNQWSGPKPTVWKRDHVYVEDGNFKVKTTRTPGDSITIDGQKLALTNIGCATSVGQVLYPVYVETRVKIMNSVLASDVWLLSGDDTQEIDICEAYGSDRWTNPWFSDERLHLSHHVFIREPFQDWQPSDEGSFYTDGSTIWSDGYHTIGVHWIDSVNLKYYVDGQLVRTRSGMEQIDPVYHTNAVDFGDPTNDTRTGLSKPMDIIINTEDQTWRALQGLTPTEDELMNTDDNTFQVDWIRIYKPIDGVVDPVSAVSIDPQDVTTFVGSSEIFTANIVPYNALDLTVVWESLDPNIATIDSDGVVTTLAEGTTQIVVTTNENNQTDTATLNVTGIAPSIEFVNEFSLLNFNYQVGGELSVSADFHTGSGNTIVNGGQGGVKFWLREMAPGWAVVNDYIANDDSVIGEESGTASAVISLIDVPATAEIPVDNWYFLYVTFQNSDGNSFDKGIYPINIVNSTNVLSPEVNQLEIFPNPAQSLLNVKNPNLKSDYTIEMISIAGQIAEVLNVSNNTATIQLDINHLPKGLYMVRLVSDEVYIASFLKQ